MASDPARPVPAASGGGVGGEEDDESEEKVTDYDVLALLPGWQDSEGAKVEKMVAEACGIEVVELAVVVRACRHCGAKRKETA